jgi:aminoglycoside phosphotransferase (APT) family kinase protein
VASMSLKRSRSPGLWLPKSYDELKSLGADSLIYKGQGDTRKVRRTAPGVVVKYGGSDFSEEARAMEFVGCKTSIPVPRILHVPPDRVWYICMTEARGTSLDKCIDSMTTPELDHIAIQITQILAQMRSLTRQTLGSVTGGPYRNTYFPTQVAPDCALDSTAQFIDEYHKMLMLFCTAKFTDELLSAFPRDVGVFFSHGDLLPRNIIVDGSTITAIVDWELAGFYPEYLEYCRMNSPDWMTPNWNYVVQSVFPGEPRRALIHAFHRLTSVIWQTLL